jgi:hypothetical protein
MFYPFGMNSEELYEYWCEEASDMAPLLSEGKEISDRMLEALRHICNLRPYVQTLLDKYVHDAASYWDQDCEVLKFLLDQGADVNSMRDGKTVLHTAAESRNPDAFELLMKRGADPRIVDKDGENVSYFLLREMYDEELNEKYNYEDDVWEPRWPYWELKGMLDDAKKWTWKIPEWSPSISVHFQYSRGFKDAVFTLLCVMRRFSVPRDVRILICGQLGHLEFLSQKSFGYWPETVQRFEVEEIEKAVNEEKRKEWEEDRAKDLKYMELKYGTK